MERSLIYSYVGNLLNRLIRADIQTNDIETAREWQLKLYHDGKFDEVDETEEKSRCDELKQLTKQDLINRVIELEKYTLRKPSIHMLPKKTIYYILKLLPLNDLVNATRTCKRWRQIARREFYWRTIIYTEYLICGDSLDLLLSRGTKELIIKNCPVFYPTFRENPASEYLLETVELDININIGTSMYVLPLMQRCRLLTKINLISVNVTHEICVAISKNVGLQDLAFHANTDNLQQGLLEIFKSCKNLKNLQYINLSEPLMEEEISELLREIPNSITVLDMFALQTSLQDYHVNFLVKNCPNITSLNLRGCIKISYDSLTYLKQLSELQYLNIAWCFGKVNDSLRSERSRSKYLYINIPHMDSLEKLGGSAKKIKKEIMKILPGVEITIQP